jgi:hypothetical protein
MDTGTSLTRGSATVFQAPSGAIPTDTVQMVVRILHEKDHPSRHGYGTSQTRGSATVFQAQSGAISTDTVQMVVRILPDKGSPYRRRYGYLPDPWICHCVPGAVRHHPRRHPVNGRTHPA